MSDFPELCQTLDHAFADPKLLTLALTHPSHGHEMRTRTPDNQRLEFLGDAVLQLSITEALYERFPDQPEGLLTKVRASLVNRDHLSKLARRLKLGAILILGRGEEANGGRDRDSNLADAMEAVIGAVYLDGGWKAARPVVVALYDVALEDIELDQVIVTNPKGALQERLQCEGADPPVYECIREEGPAHEREFEVVVEWKGKELGRGIGASKKEAETNAARTALQAS